MRHGKIFGGGGEWFHQRRMKNLEPGCLLVKRGKDAEYLGLSREVV